MSDDKISQSFEYADENPEENNRKSWSVYSKDEGDGDVGESRREKKTKKICFCTVIVTLKGKKKVFDWAS